jgi:hypothetical protein
MVRDHNSEAWLEGQQLGALLVLSNHFCRVHHSERLNLLRLTLSVYFLSDVNVLSVLVKQVLNVK